MNRFFTLLLAASCLTAVGQVGSVFFDGEDDYMNVFIPVESNDFSFSVDIKMTSLPSSGVYIFDSRLDDQRGYYMWMAPDGLTDVGWENGQDNFNVVQVSLADVDWFNSWQEITIIQTGSSLSLFVEGELKVELDGYLDAIASRDRLILGRRNDGPGHDFHGLMDNVFVGSGMLSVEDVQLAKCNGNGDGLGAGFWNLDNGATNSVGTNEEAYVQLENGAAFVDFDSIQAGCVDSDACNFNPNASCDDGSCVYPPVVELGEDLDTCEEFVVLDAGDNHDSYLWNTGDTTQFLEVSESGEYSVDVTHWSTQSEYSLDFGLQANCGFGNTWVDCGQVLESNGSFSVGGWLFNNGCDYTTIVSQRPGGSCTDPYYGPGPYNGFHLSYENDGQFEFRLHQNSNSNDPIESAATTPAIEEAWVHLVGVFESGQSVKLFLNGALVDSQPTSIEALEFCDYPFLIGSLQHGGNWSWDGKLDDVFAYSRALSDAEVHAIFESSYPSDDLSGLWRFEEGEGGYSYDASGNGHHGAITGATWSADVPESIAFVECSASDTVGVQLFSYVCLCGEGTTWDESLGECVAVLSSQNACGEGTQWDDETQTCIVANPADINLDGCVQLNDLLDLLSAYGGCEAEAPPWLCGDPLEYQGYDYATVQIGEQCWFAENLRAENYRNGDAVTSELSDLDWSGATYGAVAVFGEGESSCSHDSPEGNACLPSWSISQFGRLYNWYAVNDERALCKTGWHVPSDEDWIALEMTLGMSEVLANSSYYRGTQEGRFLKDSMGWSESNNGNNSSGFTGKPAGYRMPNGDFDYAGYDLGMWSSTPADDNKAMRRNLTAYPDFKDLINRGPAPRNYGLSVRCVKDVQ